MKRFQQGHMKRNFHIHKNIKSVVLKLLRKRKSPVLEEEFIGYEAFSLQYQAQTHQMNHVAVSFMREDDKQSHH